MGILTHSQDYEAILKDSINHFITESRKGEKCFMAERMILHRVIQTMDDPPLEFIWFYAALTFNSSSLYFQEPCNRVVVLKDLFQLVVSCSEPCSGVQRVAVLAPVLYILCSCWKREVCVRGEIEGLVERIGSYISICCVDCFEGEGDVVLGDNLMGNFVDLVRVWNVDHIGKGVGLGDALRLFFPLLSDEVRNQVDARCGMGVLAGVVMVQFFLLRLCLRVSRKEKQGDLKLSLYQAVGGFQNSCFHDMLFRMMLEPSLPVTILLSSEEERLLRRVLFDAVLLGELPFLKSGRFSQLHESHLKNMFLAWLLVADNAIEFEREYGAGQHATTVSYTQAFSRSDIPNLLIELVANQIGMKEKLSRPNTPTPRALIQWLLGLQDHGIKVFEDCSTLHAKATTCSLRQDYGLLEFKPAGDYSTPDTFLDLNGANKVCVDQEMVHDSPILTVACPVNLTTLTQGRRKRDEEMNEEEPQAKIVKWDEKKETSSNDADEEMEDIE